MPQETLRFRADGTFDILQLTDLHWKNGDKADSHTLALASSLIERVQPDLIMLTGDIIESRPCIDPAESFRIITSKIDAFHLPWAAVFGNHDAEGNITREELVAILGGYPRCLTTAGPEPIDGVGNFALPVYAKDEVRTVLFGLDSGDYADARVGGYAWIRPSQIGWFMEEAARWDQQAKRVTEKLAFFHIPLPEYAQMWGQTSCTGEKREDVCCPRVNSGAFAAMLETKGVAGTFVGHDHINDYTGDWFGIRLCYGRATGYNTYGQAGFERGGRVIRLYADGRPFDTWTETAR